MAVCYNAPALPAPACGFIADQICLLPPTPASIPTLVQPQTEAPRVARTGTDAAIFQAWADYKTRRATYEAVPNEILVNTKGLEVRLADQITEAEVRLLALPATTLEGLAVKLRMQFLNSGITDTQYKAAIAGVLPTMDTLTDIGAREALGVLLDIERMIKRPAPVTHARPGTTDPVIRRAWADFVAAQRAFAAAPRGNDEDEARELAVLEEAEVKFLEVPITSLEAIALRVRWKLQDGLLSRPLTEAVWSGAPMSFDLFESEGEVSRWPDVDMLQAVEDMIAQPATDTAIQQTWTNYLAAQAVYNSTPIVSDEAERLAGLPLSVPLSRAGE